MWRMLVEPMDSNVLDYKVLTLSHLFFPNQWDNLDPSLHDIAQGAEKKYETSL